MRYYGFLRKESGGDWNLTFPDVPGCALAARSLDELRRSAPRVLENALRSRVDGNDVIPEPRSREKLALDPGADRTMLLGVDVELSPVGGRSRRVSTGS